jgi:hypothetical protein
MKKPYIHLMLLGSNDSLMITNKPTRCTYMLETLEAIAINLKLDDILQQRKVYLKVDHEKIIMA